jgi:hypothetical protein
MHHKKTLTGGQLALIPLTFVLFGCNNEITDTEGQTYTFECKTRECILREKSDSKKKAEDDSRSAATFMTNAEGKMLLVCPADIPGFDCRPLTCDESSPCSRLGGAEFTCENALCQAPERPLTAADRLALCLAKTGRFERTPQQLERLTLARACTGDCVLPASCQKP